MCNLQTLAKNCGDQKIAGVKERVYFTPQSEIETWPQTEAELAGTDQGDTKLLNEPFDFVATVGLGYWRYMDVLVDTGEQINVLEGSIGGQYWRQRLNVFINSNDQSTSEFLDELLACSGCMVMLIPNKDGSYHVMGDATNGVYIETGEGGSGGDRVGYQLTFMANTGKTTYLYDADTHGIDITPNPTP